MQQVVVEPGLSEKFGGLSSQVIVCDSEGRALGFVSPMPDKPRVEDLQLEPLLSIGEIQELRKVKTDKPLSEILERVGVQ